MHSAFAADTRKSHSSERSSQVTQKPAVHPCDAHIHLLGYAMATLQIAGPYRGRQSVLGVVRQGDGFLFRVERCDVAHRTKDLLLHAPRRLRKSSIDGRLYVETVVTIVAKCRNAPARYDRRSFFSSQSVIREHLLAMLRRDQWSQVSLGIVGPARIQALRLPLQRLHKCIEDFALHIHALRAQTDLPGIKKYSVG